MYNLRGVCSGVHQMDRRGIMSEGVWHYIDQFKVIHIVHNVYIFVYDYGLQWPITHFL